MLKNSLAKMLPLRVAVIGGALEYVNRIASCDGDTTTSATPATRLDGLRSPSSCGDVPAITTGRHGTATNTNIACDALLEIGKRGPLPRGLRTSTQAATSHRGPGAGPVQHAPRAWGGFARVHLQRALILSLVRDGRRGGDKAPTAPPHVHDLLANRHPAAPSAWVQ